jgi:polyisoprenoid-binding protein YceI
VLANPDRPEEGWKLVPGKEEQMSVVEQAVPAGTWKADGLHSTVGIEVKHMGMSTFRAGFTDFEATLDAAHDGPALEGRARVESFDVRDDGLRPHVMSPEFLDVERHPELAFRSATFRMNGDELVVEGELTIKGVTTRSGRAAALLGRSSTPTATSAWP